MPIGTRLGTFEVTGVLHRDLSGVVYAGDDRSVLGKVAIKEYLPTTLADRMASGKVGLRSLRYKQTFQDGKERFLSNGRMLAALDEPALIRVLRCWKQNGTAYMAMPLYEGQTLGDVLRASPRPGEAWLKSLLGPLLDAVATLHRFECYPCNVTPDNIVVLQDGAPLLFAFGAGRRTTASDSGDLRHDLNPGFAPIEQYTHDSTMPEGPWTDIYALAAVIRFAITGKQLPALAARMASDTLPPLRDGYKNYSTGFLEAADRALAVVPRDRPQTIDEFRAALGIHELASGALAMVRPESKSGEQSPAAVTAKVSPEPAPTPHVGEAEGTRVAVATPAPIVLPPVFPGREQDSQDAASQATMQSSAGGLPWKLVVQLAVVGLFALGLLVWAVIERRQPASATIDRASAPPPPVATSAQPSSPPVAAAPATTVSTAPPVVVPPPIVDAAPEPRPLPDAATVATAPRVRTPPVAAAPPAPQVGRIRFSIKPWGEILIDGKSRGVSPPVKELSIPEGRHRVQIRNGNFPGYDSQVDVKAGSKGEITYSFKAP